MKTLLAIGLGGGIGSVARYALGRYVQGTTHLAFPVGTLMVNVVGCLFVGVLARRFLNDATDPVLRAALMVGFCGGFTTFSTFSLETFGLMSAGQWTKAFSYVLASTILCLASTTAGFQLGFRR